MKARLWALVLCFSVPIALILAGCGASAPAKDAASDPSAPTQADKSADQTPPADDSEKQEQTAQDPLPQEQTVVPERDPGNASPAGSAAQQNKPSPQPDPGKKEIVSMPNLDGAWEPKGYVGPRAEISGTTLIRLWRGTPVLTTEFTLSQDGGRTSLSLRENELKYPEADEPYASVTACFFENGALTFTDDFPITGESSETLYPTQNSRYGDVDLVSDTVLPRLAGRWETPDGMALLFTGNTMEFGYENHVEGSVEIAVVKNRGDGTIRIVNADPGAGYVGMFDEMTFTGDEIRAVIPVSDASPVVIAFRSEPIAPGGSTDYSNWNAPKTIVSTEITAFSCEISLVSIDRESAPELRSPRYTLTAKQDGDAVACARESIDGAVSFTADAAFLEGLQKIVAAHDLAQYNGLDRVAHGLPDDFGAHLSVQYASGERIYASDNQSMFLPLPAVQELVALFFREA